MHSLATLIIGAVFFRQVAERLKLGQSVEPETFDSVTVFFSDVVSFTKVAARGTPLQVMYIAQ